MITTLIVGIICAGVFYLIGPMGIILIGVLLAIAGVKVAEKKD